MTGEVATHLTPLSGAKVVVSRLRKTSAPLSVLCLDRLVSGLVDGLGWRRF